jgi:membrane-bound lytic murein transglycosylase B
VRRALAVLLALAAFAPPAFARESLEAAPQPAPDAAIPRDPAALAATLAATTRRLRTALDGWDPATSVPADVTYLALYHQRMLRLMSSSRRLGDAALARLAPDVRGEARDTVVARRRLAAIPRSPGRLPPVRVAPAAPAATLRGAYAEAQRRFGVDWSVLAAVNFVESAFGRVRSASQAGARGSSMSPPMP